MHTLFSTKERAYWEAKVAAAASNSKKRWQILNKLMCKDVKGQIPDSATAEVFSKFFSHKVESVRSATENAAPPSFSPCPKPRCFDFFWMRSNRLKMNTDKTQLIWIGTRQQLSKVDINEIELQLDTVSFSTSVSDLGVILDNQLKMTNHVAALCRSCFFQLRQIRSIRRSLTSDARKTLVNAFVMSRLDYCNSLCQGINEGLLNKLQHVQNADARLVTDTRKYDHITPVLRDLHWLPIRQRIVFKLATMVYKCQHGLCPSYLPEDCILLSATRGRQHLRSAGRLELLVPRTRTVIFGLRAFAVVCPGFGILCPLL